jgi:flagellar basal body L-ring protein FlgH
MLSKGLGRHFPHDEKQRLFQDAKNIADLLTVVMNRRTEEAKKRKRRNRPRNKAQAAVGVQ